MLRTRDAAQGCSLGAREAATGQLLPAAGLLAGARGLTAQAAPAAHERAPQQEQDEELEEFRDTVLTFAQDFAAPHAAEIDQLNAYPPGFDFWSKGSGACTVGGWRGRRQLGPAKCNGAAAEGGYAELLEPWSMLIRSEITPRCLHRCQRVNTHHQHWPRSVPTGGRGARHHCLHHGKGHAGKGGREKLRCCSSRCLWRRSAAVQAELLPTTAGLAVTFHGIAPGIAPMVLLQGFSTAQKLDKLGMRGSDTCELLFENCRGAA